MAADGSIVIGVNLETSKVDKDLAGLRKKIKETEAEIESLGEKKTSANTKSWALSVNLDKEQKKLADMKADLKELRAVANDKTMTAGTRAEAKMNMPALREEIKEQQERVRLLKTEWQAVANSVDRYDQKIKESTEKREGLKASAGALEKEAAALQTVKDNAVVADQHIVDLGKELAELKARMEQLKSAGLGPGYEEYDRMAARIREINAELKEFSKRTGAIDQAADGMGHAADNAQRLSPALEQADGATEKLSSRVNGLHKRVKSLVKRVLFFSVIATGLRTVRSWLSDVIKTSPEATAAIARLKGALLTMAQPLVDWIIPAFVKFVDVLAKVIASIAQFLSGLFGKTLKSSAESAESLHNQQQELNGVSASAKKAGKSLAAFDEINQLSDTTAASAAAGAVDNTIAPDFQWLKDKGISEELDGIFDIVSKIGMAFLGWKLASGLMNAVGALRGGLGGVNTEALGLKKTLGSFLISVGVTVTAGNIVSIMKGDYKATNLESLLKEVLGGAGIGGGVSALAGTPVGWSIAVAVPIVIQVTELIVNWGKISSYVGDVWSGLNKIFKEEWDPSTGPIGFIDAVLAGDIAGGLSDFGKGFAKAMTLDAWEVDLSKWIANTFGGEGTWDRALEFFGGKNLETGILEGIDEETATKLQPIIDKAKELKTALIGMEYSGQVINEETRLDTETKVNELATLISESLDSDKNETLQNLNPLKDALGEEMWNSLYTDTQEYYAQEQGQVQTGQDTINGIFATASAENRSITDEEWAEINRIQAGMQSAGISALTDSTVEHETIMRRLAENEEGISLEQSSEVIKNAQKTRDDTIDAAETQYTQIVRQAQAMYNAGAINEEQYKAITEAAGRTKDDTIKAAKDQYDEINKTVREKLGDSAKYIDDETGDIKTEWDIFAEGLEEKWRNIWNSIKTKVATIWNQIVAIIENGVNGVINGINGMIGGINGLVGDGFISGVMEKMGLQGGKIPLLKTITIPKLPALAQGAVIPPNREFLAVLGDQRRGVNIETPLDTMVQAFKTAMAETSGGKEIRIVVAPQPGFTRYMKYELDKESSRQGVSLVQGGW